jgi:hypothetical protein
MNDDPFMYAGDFKAPDPQQSGRAPMSIEDTSMYSRPMAASEQDVRVGQDDQGNPVYRDVRGKTYIVKPNEQPFQRPEGGFVRAAGRAAQNIPPISEWKFHTLGMGEAATKGARVVAEALWGVVDTPRATLAGEKSPTLGDAWDVAGFAMTGGLTGAIPEGALGVNVPMYRSRTTPKAQGPETKTPVNWEELGFTPPDDPGWARVTRQDIEDYRLGGELPDEWLERMGIEQDFWNSLEFGGVNNDPAVVSPNSHFLEQVSSYINQTSQARPPEALAQFRSPVREVLDDLEFPSKGMKGSQFMKELRDNPTVRNSEVSAMDLQIDPMQRYTREELSSLVDEHMFTVEALGAGPRHRTMQRQDVLDPEVDYEEIMINASRGEGKPMFEPKHGETHYAPNTVAHARVSVRQPDPDGLSGPDNRPYVLVEEMQSDLLQHGYTPPRKSKTFLEENKRAINDVVSEKQNRLASLDPEFHSKVIKTFSEELDVLSQLTDQKLRAWENAWLEGWVNFNPRPLEEFLTTFNQPPDRVREILVELPVSFIDPRTSITAPPITSTTESTRALVQSIMSYAQRNGVNEIVFPPLERIAAQRFQPGTEGYQKAIKPGSGFHQTYVTSLNKVLKGLEQELGPNKVHIGQRPIRYRPDASVQEMLDFESFGRDFSLITRERSRARNQNQSLEEYLNSTRLGRESIEDWDTVYGPDWRNASHPDDLRDLILSQTQTVDSMPTEGISIQIRTGDLDLSRPRFHKGGLVTRTKQALGEI